MTHYYERNIVDIKNEYTTYLTDILTPLLYEGILSIYNHSIDQYEKLKSSQMTNAKTPSIIRIFQACLRDIPSLSATAIENEVKRIREFSRCSDFFDDLIKAVIKSYIVLLTYNTSGKTCQLVNDKYHEKINICDFIHKCYIECSIAFYNNPDIFRNSCDDTINKDTVQLCKNSSYEHIRNGIMNAIHKVLPIKLILQEYLSNDYIVDYTKEYHEHDNGYSYVEGKNMLVETEDDNVSDNEITKNIKTHIDNVTKNDIEPSPKVQHISPKNDQNPIESDVIKHPATRDVVQHTVIPNVPEHHSQEIQQTNEIQKVSEKIIVNDNVIQQPSLNLNGGNNDPMNKFFDAYLDNDIFK